MISIDAIAIILILHWVADFVLQSDWMAKNKSSSNKALLTHVGIYTLVMSVLGIKFALINGFFHYWLDYLTSRKTKKLWEKGDVHNFFVVIGLDQALHLFVLFSSYIQLN